MSGGQFQGSFARARVPLPEGLSIHPNTASLVYKKPLIQSGDGLNLNLFYEYGLTGKSGLPQNWNFDIPYVVEGSSLTINGMTYPIDSEWSDASGYGSGLKYINNPDVSFEVISPPKELRSGETGTYKYKLNHPNGSSIYFDIGGKPLEEKKGDGSHIRYTFLSGEGEEVNSPGALLESIHHSSGQTIKFIYHDTQTRFTVSTGGITTEVIWTEEGVMSIEDHTGLSTLFEYQQFVGDQAHTVLTRITHPTGLASCYDCGNCEFLDSCGNPRYVPAITDHNVVDKDDHVQQHTSYDLGRFSNRSTFTGAAIGLSMTNVTDSLMDGDGMGLTYGYDVTQTSYDSSENPTAQTTTWFNNYHLPVQVIRYKPEGSEDVTEDWKAEYTYGIPVEERARAINYERPASIQLSDSDGNGGWKPRAALSEEEYQEHLDLASSYVW